MRSLSEEALALSREVGALGLIAQSLLQLARMALVEGDTERAGSLLEEGLKTVHQGNLAPIEP